MAIFCLGVVVLELTERVMGLEIQQGRLDERMEAVEQYQAKQNGKIDRVESLLFKLLLANFAVIGGVTATLVAVIKN